MNEAELLFTDILHCNRQDLYLRSDRVLDVRERQFISQALKRRVMGEPIQYILGGFEFMGFEFKVNPAVFIPRPETELLVETVIDMVHSSQCSAVHSILDIGTGSGCITVSLAKLLRNVEITATDISQEALGIARENALLNKVSDKIDFIHCDLFPTYYLLPTTYYDIIISNPPYIPTAQIASLQPEVQCEPRIALDGGNDGLDFYRRIIKMSPAFLKSEGLLVMEMGFGQCSQIKEIFKKEGKFEIIEVIKDYNAIDRVIVARKNK